MTTIDIEKENKAIAKEYKELLRISYQMLTDEDKKLIRLAFDTAVEAHKDQRRKSGEAYIFHPIAVAKIVASEIGLDATSIAAALLHDVIEDTIFTYDDMEQKFGTTVAKIVEGLTKISSLSKEKDVSLQAENFRKMLLTMNDDVRVIIIKIADRLHNMQTMGSMPEHKQLKIASETLYIYAPLAHRIGLYNIKSELEDLGLKYTEPAVYNDILSKIEDSKDCLLYTSDAADDSLRVDLGGRRIIKKIFFKQKTAYEISACLVGSEMCIRDRVCDILCTRVSTW